MENKKVLIPGEKKRTNPVKCLITAAVGKCRRLMLTVTTMITMSLMTGISAFADDTSGGSGEIVNGEAAFNSVISFFADWIGKIGLVVGFVGGIMFALAIKNDDAEAKTRGLMTMASGFVVFALTLSLNLFGITKV